MSEVFAHSASWPGPHVSSAYKTVQRNPHRRVMIVAALGVAGQQNAGVVRRFDPVRHVCSTQCHDGSKHDVLVYYGWDISDFGLGISNRNEDNDWIRHNS